MTKLGRVNHLDPTVDCSGPSSVVHSFPLITVSEERVKTLAEATALVSWSLLHQHLAKSLLVQRCRCVSWNLCFPLSQWRSVKVSISLQGAPVGRVPRVWTPGFSLGSAADIPVLIEGGALPLWTSYSQNTALPLSFRILWLFPPLNNAYHLFKHRHAFILAFLAFCNKGNDS